MKSNIHKLVNSLRPFKNEICEVLVTAGGEKMYYNENVSTYPDSIVTIKVHLNSNLSMDRARYITLYINIYTKEHQWEGMNIHTRESNTYHKKL